MAMTVLEALRRADFRGPVYPVNPRYDEVPGLPCYPSLERVAGAARSRRRRGSGAERRRGACVKRWPTAPAARRSCRAVSRATSRRSARRDELQTLLRESGLAVPDPTAWGTSAPAARFMTMAEGRVPLGRARHRRGRRTERRHRHGDVSLAVGSWHRLRICRDDRRRDRALRRRLHRVLRGDATTCTSSSTTRRSARAGAIRGRLPRGDRAGKRGRSCFKVGQSAGGREAAASHTGSLPARWTRSMR